MNDERELIGERWNKLESEAPSGEHAIRVAELPLETGNGPIVVGVDHDRCRQLVIPITSGQDVRRGLDGPALQVRKWVLEDSAVYQHYAYLGCMRTDLNDVFTTMCADVLDAAAALPSNPFKALYRVIDKWKARFRTSEVPLGTGQVGGLCGDLVVLTRLLERDPCAHQLWTGLSGHEHDFASAHTALEVKVTSGLQGRRARIHGINPFAVRKKACSGSRGCGRYKARMVEKTYPRSSIGLCGSAIMKADCWRC